MKEYINEGNQSKRRKPFKKRLSSAKICIIIGAATPIHLDYITSPIILGGTK